MESWWYLLIVVAIGVPLLAVAGWADWRSKRRRITTLESAPDREIPGGPLRQPVYIPADDVLGRPLRLATLQKDEEDELAQEFDGAEKISVGWASDRFATHDGPIRAIINAPIVLVCDEIGSFRELLTPLKRSRQLGHPLVLLAGQINPEVIDTLAANRLRLDLGLLAVVADDRIRDAVTRVLGSTPSARRDLQAGYVPETSLPIVQRWVSDASSSWFNPQPSSQG